MCIISDLRAFLVSFISNSKLKFLGRVQNIMICFTVSSFSLSDLYINIKIQFSSTIKKAIDNS